MVFKRSRFSLLQGVALIVSGTLGAGVLGIPYAVAQVGVPLGIAYIVGLGLLIMGLNILLGYVSAGAGGTLQLAGLARRYLGEKGGYLMAGITYVMLSGVITVYIIGEGEILSALFGGPRFWWSLVFWAVAALFIFTGIRTVKTVEFVLSSLILAVVMALAAWSAPHVEWPNWGHFGLSHLLLPYGIILFAFHSTTSIPEAHSAFQGDTPAFSRAIQIASLTVILLYILFVLTVVGVTGAETAEIATIGLGRALGQPVHILGNLFAALSLATAFIMVAVSFRDSLRWDFRVPRLAASVLVAGVPVIIFALGARHFIAVLDVIGGVMVSLEMLIILLIVWRAHEAGDLPVSRPSFSRLIWLIAALVLALTLGAVYSIVVLFT